MADIEQSEIGGETGDAEDAQNMFGLVRLVVFGERARREGGIFLPAETLSRKIR